MKSNFNVSGRRTLAILAASGLMLAFATPYNRVQAQQPDPAEPAILCMHAMANEDEVFLLFEQNAAYFGAEQFVTVECEGREAYWQDWEAQVCNMANVAPGPILERMEERFGAPPQLLCDAVTEVDAL
jgi:ABC-type glycerol-3-phosphate transport system substrate-binding protein